MNCECNKKSCDPCNSCDPCKKQCPDPCGCPKRTFSVEKVTNRPGFIKINIDGQTQFFDVRDITKDTETDTFLRADSVARLLRYFAEGHVNNITARQLGSILHLADIGDIDVGDVAQSSLLTYQKNSECGQGCDEISNKWVAFNASEHLEDALSTVFGFDDSDAPKALEAPAHTSQYYSLMWRGGNKVGYTQPVEVSVPSVDTDGYSQLLFMNPTTKQIESLKVRVTIDNQGNVTLKTQETA